MNQFFDNLSSQFHPTNFRHWRRTAIVWGAVMLGILVVIFLTWDAFFEYVPPGQHLIIISKDGDPLPTGQVLAQSGQKGIQEQVLGEGWHFVLPIVYETQLEQNTEIPPGKVGVVVARGGKPSPADRLAEKGEQGIQRQVLLPGSYRINKHGYTVDLVDATDIKPGFVGVLRRLFGKEGSSRFASSPDQKGIVREVLQPGMYYVNPREYEVIRAEIGIFQTTFRYDPNPAKSTAITFPSKGGFPISMDCTVEWETLPESMPALVAEYGSRHVIEQNVIDAQAHAISRDRGVEYGVQSFLEGTKREEFQNDFMQQLTKICKDKDVTIRSAFIRDIVIPEEYLKPIRDKQIAGETELTNKAKEVTAQIAAETEREQQMIAQRELEVDAETKRLVATIDREVENTGTRTQAELERLKAEYAAQISAINSQRVQTVGQAEAEVTKMKETAKSSLYQLKMDVFQNDGDAFLRYSLSEQLNPKMVLRLFHSGPGTFWTNMGEKGVNFMLPMATSPEAKPAEKTSEKK